MANSSFTRDEVILALDVLYSMAKSTFSSESPQIKELSELLNRLPIHDIAGRRADFRSCTGITKQLKLFQSNCSTGQRSVHVGTMFFDVAAEFDCHGDQLHDIAESIRRNEQAFGFCFGHPTEAAHFPEGALLGHLHRVIEERDSGKLPFSSSCDICKCTPSLYYQPCGQLLQHHLVVAPENLDYRTKYNAPHFITVCPTCHEALHLIRPWLTKENCEDLLR